MTTGRYHSLSEGLTYPVVPRSPVLEGGHLWARFVDRVAHALEREHIQRAADSFLRGAQFGVDLRIKPDAWCHNPGPRENIQIGARVVCGGILAIERFHPGRIVIHDDIYIGDDTILSSAELIEIHSQTLIAHGVQIFDHNSHPLDADARARDYNILRGLQPGPRLPIARAPIVIGPRAWVGLHAILLRGVTIGAGAVVGAGSVVTSDVPPYTLVAGNPAHVVRSLAPDSVET